MDLQQPMEAPRCTFFSDGILSRTSNSNSVEASHEFVTLLLQHEDLNPLFQQSFEFVDASQFGRIYLGSCQVNLLAKPKPRAKQLLLDLWRNFGKGLSVACKQMCMVCTLASQFLTPLIKGRPLQIKTIQMKRMMHCRVWQGSTDSSRGVKPCRIFDGDWKRCLDHQKMKLRLMRRASTKIQQLSAHKWMLTGLQKQICYIVSFWRSTTLWGRSPKLHWATRGNPAAWEITLE